MEPTDLVLEQLKGIRSDLAGLSAKVEENTSEIRNLRGDVQRNTEAIGGLSERMSAVEQAIVGYTAQITMFSRSLTVQMEARVRLEEKVDDLYRRLEALERKPTE
jgi:chromosome segregation ATPase